jgi:hypothetical protein
MGPMVGTDSGGMPQGDADFTQDPYGVPGQSTPGMGGMPTPGQGTPGLGGKGGQRPNPFSQVPVDMQGYRLNGNEQSYQPNFENTAPMPEPSSMAGLPPAPNAAAPLAKTTGGTPGRPSAAAPMAPRGPGFANPGAPGAPPPQPMERSLLTPPQTQPFQGAQQNRTQPMPIAPMTAPGPIVNPRSRVPMQAQQSMKGGMGRASRGAGRGGMLR